jgi:uncharacterized low-complexity protein
MKPLSATATAAAALLTLLTAGRAARATTVNPSTTSNCGNNVSSIWACGQTDMGATGAIRSAYVHYTGQTAVFWSEPGCRDARISAGSSGCYRFPFTNGARCVNIIC